MTIGRLSLTGCQECTITLAIRAMRKLLVMIGTAKPFTPLAKIASSFKHTLMIWVSGSKTTTEIKEYWQVRDAALPTHKKG
jgi:hypothetical protein